MKKILFAVILIVLIVLFGTWPISILAKIFEWLAVALEWVAKAINFFGWNGIL